MDLLLRLDLDWLCIAAELAAGLLILSFAWTPNRGASKAVGDESGVTIDWESLQSAFIHATTATARSQSIHWNKIDEQRLRELLSGLPTPYRDRLTGVWNANGMDALIKSWSLEPELSVYPSCYVLLTLSNIEEMVERKGPTCIEMAVRAMSESLVDTLGGIATISRYQPHRFLIHCFGKTLSDCEPLLESIAARISSTEFFSFHDEAIPLLCERKFWFCHRGVEPEELIQLLEEGESEVPSVPEETTLSESEVVIEEPVPAEEKPFSIADLAPFPCPWDDEPEQASAAPQENSDNDPIPVDEGIREPEISVPIEMQDGIDSTKVAGLASSEQIEELLSQLNGSGFPIFADEPFSTGTVEPDGDVDSMSRDPANPDMDTDTLSEATARDEVEELASERTFVSPVELPPAPSDIAKTRSIYTDDIEESLLKDDLASLFAAVRSSAVGDFGYSTAPSKETKPKSESGST